MEVARSSVESPVVFRVPPEAISRLPPAASSAREAVVMPRITTLAPPSAEEARFSVPMLLAEPFSASVPSWRDHGIGRGDVAVNGQRFVPRLDQVHTLAVTVR